jgi:hypothetical protein
MSILADLFVAKPEDAPEYEEAMGESDARFEVEQFKGFTQLELEILWAMLEQKEWDPERHALAFVEEPGDSWLCRFPDELVDRLAALAPAEVGPLSTKWAAIEELNAPPDEIAPVTEALVRLAKSAKTSGRGLFLWGSL